MYIFFAFICFSYTAFSDQEDEYRTRTLLPTRSKPIKSHSPFKKTLKSRITGALNSSWESLKTRLSSLSDKMSSGSGETHNLSSPDSDEIFQPFQSIPLSSYKTFSQSKSEFSLFNQHFTGNVMKPVSRPRYISQGMASDVFSKDPQEDDEYDEIPVKRFPNQPQEDDEYDELPVNPFPNQRVESPSPSSYVPKSKQSDGFSKDSQEEDEYEMPMNCFSDRSVESPLLPSYIPQRMESDEFIKDSQDEDGYEIPIDRSSDQSVKTETEHRIGYFSDPSSRHTASLRSFLQREIHIYFSSIYSSSPIPFQKASSLEVHQKPFLEI